MSPTLLRCARVGSPLWLALCLLAAPLARAELPPAAYQEMMAAAPEVLSLTVTAVQTTPGKDGSQVEAQATVTSVTRSATHLQAGDKISLSYAHAPLPPGLVGPGPVPVVAPGRIYFAFLEGGPAPAAYRPAARGKSFMDAGTAAEPAGAAANWPTPAQPAAADWARQDLRETKSFLLVNEGSRYFVSPAAGAATQKLPLLTSGTPPELLYLYSCTRAVAGLPPQILVYRAGTIVAGPPVNRRLTIDRALLFYPNAAKPLGDALWSVTPAGGPALPQPEWKWTADTLVVENPFERTLQKVNLAPK